MNTRLAVDVNLLIYSFLPIKDLLNVASVSKKNHELISSPLLWKQLVKRDFNIDAANNNPQKFYKDLTILSPEKKSFISYMTALELIGFKIEQKKANGMFRSDIEKEEVITKEINELDKCLMNSRESLESYCNELFQSVDELELTKIIKSCDEFFNVLISRSLSLQTEDDKNKEDNKLYALGFITLCKLDASRSIDCLLNNNARLINDTLILTGFRYPCIRVINKLLELGIDVNKKFHVCEGSLRMHVTPLMSAIQRMFEKKQRNEFHHMESYKEIISMLLQKGADTEMLVFMTEDDWHSDEEYQQRCQSIYESCKELHEDESGKENGNKLFIETMEMIIDHQEKKVSFSKHP